MRKIRLFVVIQSIFSFLLPFHAASAAPNPTSVKVVSPAPGTVINPDIPFVISIEIKGGGASTAKSCFEWNNRDLLGDLTFGAQLIDVNNFGKSLVWGDYATTGHTFGTDEQLLDWSAKIIPGGIQCSIGVGAPIGSSRAAATFTFVRDSLSNPVDTKNSEWFGTKSSEDLPSEDSFGKYAFLDIAWHLNGKVSKVRFQATDKGSPKVSIQNLERGQTIDYETFFQVTGIFSSKLELSYIGIAINGSAENWAQCEVLGQAKKIDNKDGTVTYTTDCVISLVDTNLSTESLDVQPYLYTNLGATENREGSVVVNVGKQGTPACVGRLESANSSLGGLLSKLRTSDLKFQQATSASSATVVKNDLNNLLSSINSLSSTSNTIGNEILACSNGKNAIFQNISTLTNNTTKLLALVQKFINDPVAQARALAKAKEAAKKAAAEAAAYKKNMYNYGFSFIKGLSTAELNQLYVWRFVAPGKRSLSQSAAIDWCQQLPKIVIGLPNRVGYPADSNFIKGCSDAAMRLRF